MKHKYVVLLSSIVLLGFVAWSAFSIQSGLVTFKLNKAFKVKFVAVTDTKKLEAKTGPQGTCVGNGCIEIPLAREANITFKLIGSLNDWYFTELKICQAGGTPSTCSLEDWQQSEFEVTTNSIGFPNADGVISLDFADGLTKFVLHNYNGTAQEYFYIVKACKDIDDVRVCYDSDPPIINKGRI